MKEYKHGNATIRVHGEYDLEKVKAATVTFLKKAEQQRKKVQNEARKETHTATEKIASAMEA